jgi:hypothetical protein
LIECTITSATKEACPRVNMVRGHLWMFCPVGLAHVLVVERITAGTPRYSLDPSEAAHGRCSGVVCGCMSVVPPGSKVDQGDRLEAFIAHWQGREGGQERANYALFLTQLCSALGLPDPDPANHHHDTNDYVFERVVKEVARDGSVATRRIDLYKRNSFVLEAKQSRQERGGEKEVLGGLGQPTCSCLTWSPGAAGEPSGPGTC